MPALHRRHVHGLSDPAAVRRYGRGGALQLGLATATTDAQGSSPLAPQLSRPHASFEGARRYLKDGRPAIKFNSFWTIELEEGWSLLAMHPANRHDLPFRLLTGVVDSDRFNDIGIFFPSTLDRWGFRRRVAQRHAGGPMRSVSARGTRAGIRRAFWRQGRALCGSDPGDSGDTRSLSPPLSQQGAEMRPTILPLA